MKKISFNKKIMKKVVLLVICALLVGLLTYSIVDSYVDKRHTTTNSDNSTVNIPSGSYQDYIKKSVGIESTKLDAYDINDIIGTDSKLQFHEIYDSYINAKLSSDIVINGTEGIIKNAEDGDNKWPSNDADINEYDKYLNGEKGSYVGEKGSITFEIKNIQEKGFYYIVLSYFIPRGKGSAVQRKILVNDTVLFDDLLTMNFTREYTNAEEIKQDINGNDLKPSQKEIYKYHENEYLHDPTGYISTPYLILLNEGDNTITFESIKEGLVITELRVSDNHNYKLPTYEEYAKKYTDKQMTIKDIENYKYEAEGSNRTASTPTLYPISDRSSVLSTPNDPVRTKYNAIGGSKWSSSGDTISWTVNVEEEGFYQLAFRAKQDLSRGMFATRKLLVDGVQPFSEAANLRFYYNSDYQMVSLGNKAGDIYYLYLEKGEHTLSLQATLGDYGSAISRVNKVVDKLNDLYLRIIAITTTNPDDYTDYKIYGDNSRLGTDQNGEKIDLQKVMSSCAIELNDVSKYITELTGEKSSLNNVLDKIVLQIGGYVDFDGDGKAEDVGGFANKPRNVTRDLNAFKTNLSSLGTWVMDVQQQTLTIESFYLAPKGSELPNAKEGFFKGLWFGVRGFFGSFFFDYESIGVISEEGFDHEIEVWFLTSESSGREQANVVKNLIDMYFTYENEESEKEVPNYKDYNCNVILKVLASSVLLPATLAGTGPDVAINVGEGLPINYALRGAVYNLKKFDDFQEVVDERFTREEMIPMMLGNIDDPNSGCYGFPNTASFLVMFYRTDIFEKNGWEVPKTWDDVTNLVKELSVQNLDFYLPLEGAGSTIFSTILYQMGGQFYNDEQTACDFSTETAKKAFEQWCSYFCDYGFEKSANFTNRFRSGEMPIGITGYTLYNTLSVFAPDIAGKWAFAPLPGYQQEDGTINNKGVLSLTSTIIMEQTKHPEESWAFLKWWSSTVVQEKYSIEIESILGSGARHNTANINALESLPWSKDELDILLSQFYNAFGIPEVPGGYYIGRNLENAIREVINNDSNPRETLAEYVELINSEITRKRDEFGMSTYKGEGK